MPYYCIYNYCMHMNEDYFLAVLSLIKTGHAITHRVSLELKPYGITEPQFNVLRILRGKKGPMSVFEIQENMIQKSSNVTRIIDKLEKKSLVQRQECKSNRRKMDIEITAAGLDYLQQLDRVVYTLHEPLMANITSVEAKQLTNLIQKFTSI